MCDGQSGAALVLSRLLSLPCFPDHLILKLLSPNPQVGTLQRQVMVCPSSCILPLHLGQPPPSARTLTLWMVRTTSPIRLPFLPSILDDPPSSEMGHQLGMSRHMCNAWLPGDELSTIC